MTDWTPERETTLTSMWRNGYTARVIAEKLGGVTRVAVIGKAHRLGLSKTAKPVKKTVFVGVHNDFKACQWPIGDPTKPDFHFCGSAEVVPGRPYCRTHCRVAYQSHESRARLDKYVKKGLTA